MLQRHLHKFSICIRDRQQVYVPRVETIIPPAPFKDLQERWKQTEGSSINMSISLRLDKEEN